MVQASLHFQFHSTLNNTTDFLSNKIKRNLKIVTKAGTESTGGLTATPAALLKSYTLWGHVSRIWEELGYRKRGVFLRPSRSFGCTALKAVSASVSDIGIDLELEGTERTGAHK